MRRGQEQLRTDLSAAGPAAPFFSLRPGRLAYPEALALQERLVAGRRGGPGDVLLLLEHPPVVTLGRAGAGGQLLRPAAELAQRGIAVQQTSRGGAVTYHGPGQLVGYPIVDLEPLGRDLHRYLRLLEELLLAVLAELGVQGSRRPGRTGIWVGNDKVAAIGVAVRHWVSWHGFALNLGADLTGFADIVPCGLADAGITSVARLTGRDVPREAAEELAIAAFAGTFHRHHAGCYDLASPA